MKLRPAISKATIDRLPLYFRTLRNAREDGLKIISSEELGRRLAVTPEQIRKDFSAFGEFGKKGVGYYVDKLIANISDILGLDVGWNVAIIGVGHLGWALANYHNFQALGFHIAAIFDNDPGKIGQVINGVQVANIDYLEDVVRDKMIKIGIITVPVDVAQQVADRLVAAGVNGIWNFAPIKLEVPLNTCLVNEDLAVGLTSISYFLSRE